MHMGKKVIAFLLSILLIFLILGYIRDEKGRRVTPEQKKEFEKLPYYKNGKFFNPYKPIEGYKNTSPKEENVETLNLFKMLWKLRKIKKVKINKVELSIKDFEQEPDDFSVRWLGHAMVLLEVSNKRILIDPVFGSPSPIPFIVKRNTKAPLKRKYLKNIDYILITHNHYDHLERKTIQKFRKTSKFIVPLGVGVVLEGWGVDKNRITELGWGDQVIIDDNLKITAEPAIHMSNRWINDFNETLWNSYVIQTNKSNIFCAGDGTYGEHIDMIAQKYKNFDIAMVESDAWNASWKYMHMFTRESIEVIKKLNAKYLLPVHWGIFDLGMHDFDLSIHMLEDEAKNAGLYDKLLLPAMGEKVLFDKDNNAKYTIKSL